jgi:general secretion pathway protein K
MARKRQRGVALLIAMLTVALVATFAAASLWQQWRSVEIETAERARVQSGWILTGALDWSRLLLREDARPNGSTTSADHLGEPWAVPLQEARLSSFLAAEKNVANNVDFSPEVMDAFLSGQIIDLQSMMNLANLVDSRGELLPDRVASFTRLFQILGLPASDLDRLTENLRVSKASTLAAQSSSEAPLPPQKVEQLVWLGLSPRTVAALQPYVTILPRETPVNVNTAPPEVIAAAANIDMALAQSIVQQRERTFFRTVDDFKNRLTGVMGSTPEGQGVSVDVKSSFFEVRARLRLDQLVVEEQSVLHRDGIFVNVVRRERGAIDPTELSRTGSR